MYLSHAIEHKAKHKNEGKNEGLKGEFEYEMCETSYYLKNYHGVDSLLNCNFYVLSFIREE